MTASNMSQRPRSLFSDEPEPAFHKEPRQFGLRAIFIAIAIIAVSLALLKVSILLMAWGLFAAGILYVLARYREPWRAATGVFVVHSIHAVFWMCYAISIADGFHDRFVTYFAALWLDMPLALVILRSRPMGSFGHICFMSFVVGGVMWWWMGYLASVSIERIERWWNAHEYYP